MTLVQIKTSIPLKAQGGDRYEWKEADTIFETILDSKHLIQIRASAENGDQNGTGDDDDLRIELDGYKFGKYEEHDNKISWKGFGTGSSWDGASLKGRSKEIYFFVKLKKGKHTIKFFADGTPKLENIKIQNIDKTNSFNTSLSTPFFDSKVDKKGLPIASFVFFGVKPDSFEVSSVCMSAKQKKATDGDNLKVIRNGNIIQNEIAPTSKKYKNFYFSGDLNKGESDSLVFNSEDFEFIEDSIELWYDEDPTISVNIDLHDNIDFWLSKLSKSGIDTYFKTLLWGMEKYFERKKWKYSEKFLAHSQSNNPQVKKYGNSNELTQLIKKNTEYQKILSIIKKQIGIEGLEGQIHLGDTDKKLDVNFENNPDLTYSLHGIKKIEYKAQEISKGVYDIDFTLFDIYDFDIMKYELLDRLDEIHVTFGNNTANQAEIRGLITNFEIRISIKDKIDINEQ